MADYRIAPPAGAGQGPVYTDEYRQAAERRDFGTSLDMINGASLMSEMDKAQELVDQAYADAVMTVVRQLGSELDQDVITAQPGSATVTLMLGFLTGWSIEEALLAAATTQVAVRFEKCWQVTIRDQVVWEL